MNQVDEIRQRLAGLQKEIARTVRRWSQEQGMEDALGHVTLLTLPVGMQTLVVYGSNLEREDGLCVLSELAQHAEELVGGTQPYDVSGGERGH